MSRPKPVFICGYEDHVRQPCPKGGEDHTPFPNGYVSAHDYAATLSHKGHKQRRCPTCNLYGIWLPTPLPTPKDQT